MGRVNIGIVAGTSLSGSFLWSFILASIGFKLGENWEMIGPYFREFDYLVLIIIVILFSLFVWLRLKGKKNGQL
jgi:membrane protein DedA with SNARE-associated domain